MGKQARLHKQAVIAGAEKPFRTSDVPRQPYLTCNKCHTAMPMSQVTEHLKECQPNGATCGRCGEIFKPDVFLNHILNCPGKPKPEPAIPSKKMSKCSRCGKDFEQPASGDSDICGTCADDLMAAEE